LVLETPNKKKLKKWLPHQPGLEKKTNLGPCLVKVKKVGWENVVVCVSIGKTEPKKNQQQSSTKVGVSPRGVVSPGSPPGKR